MGDHPLTSRAPKRALVRLILETFPADQIGNHFHTAQGTSLQDRLEDFRKPDLLAFIHTSPEGEAAFRDLEQQYPQAGTATLYLVIANPHGSLADVRERASERAESERDGGEWFGADRSVRVVYVAGPALHYDQDGVVEVPLMYERRIEYTEGDPTLDTYGQMQVVYSLETAFLWLTEGEYGIVCSPDYVALRPILSLASRQLGVRAWMLNLDEETLMNLALGATPRSATFSGYGEVDDRTIDAQTVTLYDAQLADRRGFRSLLNSPMRHQTAGFYSDHPGLMIGGLGISTRYGRIWTPRHLTKPQLLKLALELIDRTRMEFARQHAEAPHVWVKHFAHVPVEIAGTKLAGERRAAFDLILSAYVEASGRRGETRIGTRDSVELIGRQIDALHMVGGYQIDCPNCGRSLAVCPNCELALAPRWEGDRLLPACSRHGIGWLDADTLTCACGEHVPTPDTMNAIWMVPEPALMEAIRLLYENAGEPFPNQIFHIEGDLLTVEPMKPPPALTRATLADLRSWRMVARIHQREHIGDRRRAHLMRTLYKAREKCAINNYHPSWANCQACFRQEISVADLESGKLCLPRILGLAIHQEFDGIHHGHEGADIIFEDVCQSQGESVRVGIHLKSRTTGRPRGLGRSVDVIRGLYTQLFYSVYQVLRGELPLNIVGVSVPNTVKDDVVTSMQDLVNGLGLPFILVDEDEWLKIVDAVVEELIYDAPLVPGD